jgi:hypothetical protein
MAADARTKIMIELVAEFVEERVRQLPNKTFGIDDVSRALAAMLRDAEGAVEAKPGDSRWIADWLDRHPFLLKAKAGSASQWKPGLNKAALKG